MSIEILLYKHIFKVFEIHCVGKQHLKRSFQIITTKPIQSLKLLVETKAKLFVIFNEKYFLYL